jgi:hypothetical protein
VRSFREGVVVASKGGAAFNDPEALESDNVDKPDGR